MRQASRAPKEVIKPCRSCKETSFSSGLASMLEAGPTGAGPAAFGGVCGACVRSTGTGPAAFGGVSGACVACV